MTLLLFYLLVGFGCIGLSALAIVLTRPSSKIGRIQYIIQYIGLAIFAGALFSLAEIFSENSWASLTATLVALGLLVFFMSRWSAERAQHIGWPKWTSVFALIPYVSFVGWFVFALYPGEKKELEPAEPAEGAQPRQSPPDVAN